MQYPQIQRIIGILLMLFSTSMLPAAAVGQYYHEEAINAFISGFGITIYRIGLYFFGGAVLLYGSGLFRGLLHFFCCRYRFNRLFWLRRRADFFCMVNFRIFRHSLLYIVKFRLDLFLNLSSTPDDSGPTADNS
jgi:hypothetical protein